MRRRLSRYVVKKPELMHTHPRLGATWYEDSTLPHFVLNRTMSSARPGDDYLLSAFGTGRFYANEGIGCCAEPAPTCGTTRRRGEGFFPELERDTRERVDLASASLRKQVRFWFRASRP